MITLNYLVEIRDLKNKIVELGYKKNEIELLEYKIKIYVFKWYKWQLFKRTTLKDVKL